MKEGDIIETRYGKAKILKVHDKTYSVEILEWNGVGYPAKFLAVSKSLAKLLETHKKA